MELTLAQPRGFCAGVVRAIDIVEQALELYGPPVYVLHEIVHNKHVVADLSSRGAVFVESLDRIPSGAVTIFSAHGVGSRVVESAYERGLRVVDATCPLVTKVHLQAQRYHKHGKELVIIGHRGHPEVVGTMGRVEGRTFVISEPEEVADLPVENPDELAFVTQTTLSVDDTRDVIEALRRRFPKIQGPALDDICYATQNRQSAVKELAGKVDVLLVVGAQNSSNSNRLREVGEMLGVRSYLIQGAREIDPAWFGDCERIGITAGASAPEVLVQDVIHRLRELGLESVTEMPSEGENVSFALPHFPEVPDGARR